jgi:hypothetical protein
VKVLLVAINRLTVPFPVYPLGIDYVAGALRGRHDVHVLDLGATDDPDALVKQLMELDPGAVGISIRNIDNVEVGRSRGFIEEHAAAIDLVRRNSRATVILGGGGFNIFPDVLIKRLGADFGIVGEGERLGALLDALQHGQPTDSIQGVVRADHAVSCPPPWPGPYVRELSSAAAVDHYVREGGMLNVQTKRGCPYRCMYCTYPSIEGRRLRLFDPQAVAREWVQLTEAGAKFLFVADAVFNAHVSHNLSVAQRVIEAGCRVPWCAFFAPLRPRDGYYEQLAKAGLTHVEFGTESLSARMLRTYRKPFTCEHVKQAHRAARSAGLHVAHYFMLGGPGESRETVIETLDGCEQLASAALFFFCGVRVYPGTSLHELALRQGQVKPDQDLLDPTFYRPSAIGTDEISGMVAERAKGRLNWVIGSGDDAMSRMTARMRRRGMIGPLWDRIIP